MKVIETISIILLLVLMQSAVATFVIVDKQAGFSEGYSLGYQVGRVE